MGVYQSKTAPEIKTRHARYMVGMVEMGLSRFTEKQWIKLIQQQLDIPRRVKPLRVRESRGGDQYLVYEFSWYEVITD